MTPIPPEDLKQAVKFAQSILNVNSPVSVDGVWGNNTEAAFKGSTFQGAVKASMKAVHPRATPNAAYAAYSGPKARAHDVSEITRIITKVAREFGEKPVVMIGKARIESNLNPMAKNGQFAGLFQMGEAAWADARVYLKQRGFDDVGPYSRGKFDPELNARAACGYRIALRSQLRSAGYAGEITESVLYLAHQQGAGGFASLVKADENTRLSGRQIEAMRRNPPQDGGGVTTDPKEFVSRWLSVADSKLIA